MCRGEEDPATFWSAGGCLPSFLEAIENENHPEHAEYLDWIGGSFDPEQFDLEAVNAYLKEVR